MSEDEINWEEYKRRLLLNRNSTYEEVTLLIQMRIAEALEKMLEGERDSPERVKMIKGTDHVIEMDLAEGEKSVKGSDIHRDKKDNVNVRPEVATTDSYPLPKTGQIQWITHEGRKYKDCKFCENLVSWNHDTNNYDHFNRGFKYLYPKCNIGGG